MAGDRDDGIEMLEEMEKTICYSLSSDPEEQVFNVLEKEMLRLSGLERSCTLSEVTQVLLTGEIYVRRDGFSSHDLVSRLAKEGILVKTSPVLEWVFYIDHIVVSGILDRASMPERLVLRLRNYYARRLVEKVQGILELSGFFHRQHLDVGFLLKRAKTLIDPRLTGEAILTVGSALAEIGDDVHGVISISPFGCMPGRIAEAVIKHRIADDKPAFSRKNGKFWRDNKGCFSFPFLALETDGKPLSQMAETKLESFIRSAHRFNRELKETEGGKSGSTFSV
jgi:predicted nucleotide-binding protein (sugar kinase/HSP70/actin superfamily)